MLSTYQKPVKEEISSRHSTVSNMALVKFYTA